MSPKCSSSFIPPQPFCKINRGVFFFKFSFYKLENCRDRDSVMGLMSHNDNCYLLLRLFHRIGVESPLLSL